MCRDRDHGKRRCPSDTSEARRRRRKASSAKAGHSPHVTVQAGKVQPFEKPMSMEEIKTEAKEISTLLHAPCHPDPTKQDEIDAELEKRVTRLGLAIGEEVDRRANFDTEEAEKEYGNAELEQLKEQLEGTRKELVSSMTELGRFQKSLGDKPTPEEEAEIQRLKKPTERHHAELKKLQWQVNNKNLEVEFNKGKNATPTEERLSQACREVLAEIRPVGGTIEAHPLSDAEAVQKLQDTVGAHYPSAWIGASEKSGKTVLKASANRGSYIHEETYDAESSEDVIAANGALCEEESKVNEIYGLLTEDGDTGSVTLPGHPFMNGDMSCRVLMYDKRVAFDPSTDEAGADGKPRGEGWQYGRVTTYDDNGNMTPSEDKKWYRIQTNPGKTIPTIHIPPVADPTSSALAYHEFCHRAELTLGEKDSRGAGLLERQQEAFLKRRTTTEDGNRESLTYIGAPSNSIFDAEIGRPSDFMIAYVGKEYLTAYSREVLPVGAEAAFGNRFGSFHGLGEKGKKDLDHRGFTLGIFATA